MHKVSRLLWFQFGLCLLISLALFALSGRREALSAFAGGMVAFLPALLFARNVFRYQGARSARQIAKSMYVGEGLKIIFSVALFTLVFVFYKVAPLTFFLTYIAVVLSHWFAPLIIANKQK
ncbi:ATP synthase subunit I [Legionella sp. CNM-4043-24]|uniref:ATP synthase subunit I n=1 Tax=Legionella sp. CNM-4043-24 TaxID=3421646 RepID=UPI00403B2E47